MLSNFKKQKGLSLIEITLAITAALGIIASSFIAYKSLERSNFMDSEVKKLFSTRQQIMNLMSTTKTFELVDTTFINTNISPKEMSSLRPDTSIWKTPISYGHYNETSANDSFSITYSNLDNNTCSTLASRGGVKFSKLTINGNVITRETTGNKEFRVAEISSKCALPTTDNNNTVVFGTKFEYLYCPSSDVYWGGNSNGKCHGTINNPANHGGASGAINAFFEGAATSAWHGSASFTCDNGQWIPNAGATCEGPICTAKKIYWGDDATGTNTNLCWADLPDTDPGPTLSTLVIPAPTQNLDMGYQGSAQVTCTAGNVWSTAGNICKKKCVGNLASPSWSDPSYTSNTCEGWIPNTVTADNGDYYNLTSTTTADQAGSVRLRCDNGNWVVDSNQSCVKHCRGNPAAGYSHSLTWLGTPTMMASDDITPVSCTGDHGDIDHGGIELVKSDTGVENANGQASYQCVNGTMVPLNSTTTPSATDPICDFSDPASWLKYMGTVPATVCGGSIIIHSVVDFVNGTFQAYDYSAGGHPMVANKTFPTPFQPTPLGAGITYADVCPDDPNKVVYTGVTYVWGSTVNIKPTCANNYVGEYTFVHGCGGGYGDPTNPYVLFKAAPKSYPINEKTQCSNYNAIASTYGVLPLAQPIAGIYKCTVPSVGNRCNVAGPSGLVPSAKGYSTYNAASGGVCIRAVGACMGPWALNSTTGMCVYP